LLQVLDNGRLTDSKGRHVNFKNTILVMTSNVGSEFVKQMAKIGFSTGQEESQEKVLKTKIHSALESRFRPEFLNRLDEIVIFNSLTLEDLKKIVSIQIKEVEGRLNIKDLGLKISNDALVYLAQNGFSSQYGARPLKRLIQTKILNSVAEFIISGKISSGDAVDVYMKKGELAIDEIVKKRKRAKKLTTSQVVN